MNNNKVNKYIITAIITTLNLFFKANKVPLWIPLNGRVYRPAEYLRHASVADLEDARYVAGPCARVGQLDDLLPRGVGQGPAVHVDAAELVDAAVARRGAAEDRALAHHRAGPEAAAVHHVLFWNQSQANLQYSRLFGLQLYLLRASFYEPLIFAFVIKYTRVVNG